LTSDCDPDRSEAFASVLSAIGTSPLNCALLLKDASSTASKVHRAPWRWTRDPAARASYAKRTIKLQRSTVLLLMHIKWPPDQGSMVAPDLWSLSISEFHCALIHIKSSSRR
jgi:hypothetical protein